MTASWLLYYTLHLSPAVVVGVRSWLKTKSIASTVIASGLVSVVAMFSFVAEYLALLVFQTEMAPWVVAVSLNLLAFVFPIWRSSPRASAAHRDANAL
jgi:hypothetical protein